MHQEKHLIIKLLIVFALCSTATAPILDVFKKKLADFFYEDPLILFNDYLSYYESQDAYVYAELYKTNMDARDLLQFSVKDDSKTFLNGIKKIDINSNSSNSYPIDGVKLPYIRISYGKSENWPDNIYKYSYCSIFCNQYNAESNKGHFETIKFGDLQSVSNENHVYAISKDDMERVISICFELIPNLKAEYDSVSMKR